MKLIDTYYMMNENGLFHVYEKLIQDKDKRTNSLNNYDQYKIAFIKNLIIDKMLKKDIDINIIIDRYLNSNDYKKEILKNVILIRLVNNDYNLLEIIKLNKIIKEFDIESIWLLTRNRDKNINKIANNSLETIFYEYEQKLKEDFEYKVRERGNKNDKY